MACGSRVLLLSIRQEAYQEAGAAKHHGTTIIEPAGTGGLDDEVRKLSATRSHENIVAGC